MGVRRKFSRGGQHLHFADICHVADDAMQMEIHETLYRFYMTTPQRKCPMLRQQSQKICFVGSHSQVQDDNFHNIGYLQNFKAGSSFNKSIAMVL